MQPGGIAVMKTVFEDKLAEIEAMLDQCGDPVVAVRIHELLGGGGLDAGMLAQGKLYSETLPKGHETPFTPEQRHLHFLWDAFDRLPLSLLVPFSIPFRRLLGQRLFKRCGKAFIAEENVRFNFAQFIELGDNVFFNRGVFIDSKGGVSLGNYVALAESVCIFTHTHSEASHIERTYAPVVVHDYAKIYSHVTIMPGITIGREAIVASHALVTHDVPEKTVVAGIPARVLRERKTEGRQGDELDHIWLY